MSNYDDIINLKRPKSSHSPLSVASRAAQFSPFAALTGYDSEIEEAKRLTTKKRELSSEIKSILNAKLNYLNNHKEEEVTIIYFVNDSKKTGGQYVSINSKIKKIDDSDKSIKLEDNTIILMNNIIDITSDIFENW